MLLALASAICRELIRYAIESSVNIPSNSHQSWLAWSKRTIDSTLGHHRHEIPIAQPVGDIPTYAKFDELGI